jgi:hypothetical protein
MLEPNERTVLTNALRGPAGFRVDRVISTTYSLDLAAQLTLPLSFTIASGDGIDGSGRVDVVTLLDALRRHAERVLVFCQGGRIAVPRRGLQLMGFLENSIFEVSAPRGGAFHPKLTIARYVLDPDHPAWSEGTPPGPEEVRYRLLCGTRNLTFDRCWDTMLVLEGTLTRSRSLAFSRNRPLVELIAALPAMALRSMPEEKATTVAEFADELLRVQFEPPEGFDGEADGLAFWAIGLNEKQVWPFRKRSDGILNRILVISPFLDGTCLSRLNQDGTLEAVVSRTEELDTLPADVFKRANQWHVLADAAEGEPIDEAIASGTGSTERPPSEESPGSPVSDLESRSISIEPSEPDPRGLHAKLFIAERGWEARLWTGSANATSAAFEHNVEFLVELRGKKSKIGIDALLKRSDRSKAEVGFGDLLVPYRPRKDPVATDSVAEKLEKMLDEARRSLVHARLVARVAVASDSLPQTPVRSIPAMPSPAEPTGQVPVSELPAAPEAPISTASVGASLALPKQSYDVVILASAELPEPWPEGVECLLRPISLPIEQAATVTSSAGTVARFSRLAYESLTGFCAVDLTGRLRGKTLGTRFVLSVPLEGAIGDRARRLLLSMLNSKERLLRYLLMLLDEPESVLAGDDGQGSSEKWAYCATGAFGIPLLEPLLRSLANNPSRLDPIERLVRDLEATEEGRTLLPPEFLAVWTSIRQFRAAAQAHRVEEAHA